MTLRQSRCWAAANLSPAELCLEQDCAVPLSAAPLLPSLADVTTAVPILKPRPSVVVSVYQRIGGAAIPKYLVQANYTAEGLNGLQKEGAGSRVHSANKVAETLGGRRGPLKEKCWL
jgi:hypothetical protein